ncbi:hypothetical protein NB703_003759 [Pantoea ananatis]|uniref:Uncharacterized protein n=1 Tax=Pantoea ananas TaxID=553 RepID=A0AAJ1D3D4_PANAN|nr:hypothetical protein [Pantoea ananatis]
MPFDTVIKNTASPAKHVISNCRRATLDDFLQHIVDMPGFNLFDSEMPDIRVDVFIYATSQNVRVLPPVEDLTLKVFRSQF